MPKADSGISWLAAKRSKPASTSTERLTPATTVSIALGPTKRITARYRPSAEKNSSAEATATRKYASVRSSAGSSRSNFSARAAHSAVGIATASAVAIMRRLVSRGSPRMATAAESASVAGLPAACLSPMPPPPMDPSPHSSVRALLAGRPQTRRHSKAINRGNRQESHWLTPTSDNAAGGRRLTQRRVPDVRRAAVTLDLSSGSASFRAAGPERDGKHRERSKRYDHGHGRIAWEPHRQHRAGQQPDEIHSHRRQGNLPVASPAAREPLI